FGVQSNVRMGIDFKLQVLDILGTELSHNLQQLSEKARSTTEFIQRLKGMSDKVTESCMEFERLVHAQCEALIQAIHDRREYLLEAIRMDKDTKIRILKEVYCGKETICTVDGLHFNSMYNARVKAFNSAGEGEYSALIGLQTAEVAWFTFDPVLSGGAGSGLIFSKNNATVSVEGWEHRVALGSVGFSRGVHYWEFTIDNYTADTDPAFGVARIDVARNKMLGKDEKSFAMYIDRQRSWFQHNSIHERRVEGGITTGSTIGVLLDLERHTLSFLVNEMPQGSVAFRDLYGVFYPAVSINRGVTLTMHTAMDAPKMDYF
ncbi:GL26617, partial [Drosophila persimilis]